MSPKRWRLAAFAALALAVSAVFFWLRNGEQADHTLPPEAVDPREEAAAPVVAPSPRFVSEAPAVEPPPPGPVGATPPRSEPHDPGFCPEPGEELVVYPRPGLAQLLNERTDELVARARLLSRDGGSPALRRGLNLLNEPRRGVDAIAALSEAPDRLVDGFDFASAGAVAAGARALAEGRDVDPIVEAAKRSASEDPIVHVLAAHVALQAKNEIAARDALRQALAQGPEEPAVALALGRALSNTPDEDAALAAIRTYLAVYDDDVEMSRLAARLELRRDVSVSFRRVDRGGVSLRYPPSVGDDAARATLDTASEVLVEAARMLGVSPRPELAIVVYESREALRAVTCVPGWAGGVYDGSLRLTRDTVVHSDERLRVVRHEGLHAALGAAAGPTPYWFNEGLAQRFAHERSRAHEASWARIRRSGMTIPFPSIEGSFLDIDDPDDARLAYHQSLAMVDLLATRRGERVFSDAVTYMSGGGDRTMLLEELGGARPMSNADLVEFLRAE